MFGGNNARDFQKGIDALAFRRDREASRLSLRKKKREEQLQRKRRQIISSSSSNSNKKTLNSSGNIDINSVTLNQLNSYIFEVSNPNSDLSLQIHGTQCIRILLSGASSSPPYNDVLSCNILPSLLSFFSRIDSPKLQFESAWALVNLCADSSCCKLITSQYNIIKYFTDLLTLHCNSNSELIEQAIWGLGNIAGENEDLKNSILKCGIFKYLCDNIEGWLSNNNNNNNYTLASNTIWCISNLVRGQKDDINNLCPWINIRIMLPVFERILNDLGGKLKKYSDNDKNSPIYNSILKCVTDSIWAIQYTQIYCEYESTSSYLSDIFSTSICDMLIYFMQMDSISLCQPSLRVLGTFISGEDHIIEKCVEKGYLRAAMLNLGCKSRSIRKEVCWSLSNICAGNKILIRTVLDYDNGQLLKMIINLCLFDDDQVKKEAGWILGNIISSDDRSIIDYLVSHRVISALKFVMKTASIKSPLVTCIDAFEIICHHTRVRDGGKYDYISAVEEAGCCEIFDILQAGVDSEDAVYNAASKIMLKYWPDDDNLAWKPGDDNNDNNNDNDDIKAADDDDITCKPIQSGNQFGFGINNLNNQNNQNNQNNNDFNMNMMMMNNNNNQNNQNNQINLNNNNNSDNNNNNNTKIYDF